MQKVLAAWKRGSIKRGIEFELVGLSARKISLIGPLSLTSRTAVTQCSQKNRVLGLDLAVLFSGFLSPGKPFLSIVYPKTPNRNSIDTWCVTILHCWGYRHGHNMNFVQRTYSSITVYKPIINLGLNMLEVLW